MVDSELDPQHGNVLKWFVGVVYVAEIVVYYGNIVVIYI